MELIVFCGFILMSFVLGVNLSRIANALEDLKESKTEAHASAECHCHKKDEE